MVIGHKTAAMLLVVAGFAVAVAYDFGKRYDSSSTAEANAAKAAPAQSSGALTSAAAQNAPEPAQEEREGRLHVDPGQAFTHFRVGNKNVKAIYPDGKVMWVGTSGGVIRYDTDTDQFKLYDARNGLLSNGIFYIGKLDRRIAVGTYGGGLSLLDEGTGQWDSYNVPDGLGDAFVYSVLQSSNGDIWIATWSGANRVRNGALKDRSKWELFTAENTKGGLPNDWVYGLAEGKNGEIWFATEGGLARFQKGVWSNWNHASGLGTPFAKVKNDIQYKNDPSQISSHHAQQKREMGLEGIDVAYNPNYIVSMVVDRDGVVWAGTWGGGLARFDGRRWKNYSVSDGLPGNHIFMLHLDPQGQLWIGTNNGLARLDHGKFHVMTTRDGLFANNIFSMATAQDGSLWIGSFGGVAHIRRMIAK
jgi:ligand-binding sensor domain-containing protein